MRLFLAQRHGVGVTPEVDHSIVLENSLLGKELAAVDIELTRLAVDGIVARAIYFLKNKAKQGDGYAFLLNII